MKKLLSFGFVMLLTAFTMVSTTNCQQSTSHDGPISVEEFDKIIGGDKLVMVDFYTTWCGPCKRMAPFIQQIKEQHSNTVIVLKVDTEAADLS